jgi:hypothetical protein
MTWLAVSLLALVFLAAPSAVEAQSAKVPRIGVLVVVPPVILKSFQEEFHAGLRELGYVEGRTSSLTTGSSKERLSVFPLSPANWFGSRSMSSWRQQRRPSKRRRGRRVRSLSSCSGPASQSGPGWWPASPGQAGTPQDSRPNLPSSVESAWSSSGRSCPR